MRQRVVTWLALAGLVLAPAAAAGPLPDAVRAGDRGAVAAALAAGADPDRPEGRPGLTATARAAVRGEADVLADLLAAGADPDAPSFGGQSALALAVRSCRVTPAVVEALAAAGADLEAGPANGLTPLMIAIEMGRWDAARALIDAGADVAAVNRYGDGVLNFAIYYERPQLIRAALEGGAPVAQLAALFTNARYYPVGFGAEGVPARRAICR